MFGSLLTMSLALPPLYMMFKDTGQRGWGFSSVIERLPSNRKALGSVPSSAKKKKKERIHDEGFFTNNMHELVHLTVHS